MEKKDYVKNCMDCAFFELCDDGETKCHCNKHDKDIYIIEETIDSITFDTDICDDFEEARYQITEKGILSVVLTDLNIVDDIIDKRIDTLWTLFIEKMKKYGFYVETDTDKDVERTSTTKSPSDFMSSALKVVFGIADEDIQDAIWTLFSKGMKEHGYF